MMAPHQQVVFVRWIQHEQFQMVGWKKKAMSMAPAVTEMVVARKVLKEVVD